MLETQDQDQTAEAPVRVLTAEDRCDSCSAGAKVVATVLNGELMFCGHHARKLKDSLELKAINIYDPENVLF